MKIIRILLVLLFATIMGQIIGHATELPALAYVFTASLFTLSFYPGLSAVFFSYIPADVIKPGGNKGKGGDKKSAITFFDWNDVISGFERDASGIVITGPLVFKANTSMYTLYATPSTISAIMSTEGDPDAMGIIQTLELSHPGSELAIREFRYNWLDIDIGIIIEHCSSAKKDLYGSPCAPLKMSYVATDNNETNTTLFTLTNEGNKNVDVGDYLGTMIYAAPVDTVPVDDTSVDLSAGPGQYALQDNTVATVLTTCGNAVHGMIFTLLGSGGTNPAQITDANDFQLVDGVTWSGLTDAQITFLAFDIGTGWIFIEQSRS